jgi:PhnB protein
MRDQVTPYLVFEGKAKEALHFYQELFGAEIVRVQTYGEADYPTPPEASELIMYAQLKKGGLEILFSDGFPGQSINIGNNVSLAVELESDQEIENMYEKLRQNGKTVMELQDTFWGARFAKVQDAYGVVWDLNYQKS